MGHRGRRRADGDAQDVRRGAGTKEVALAFGKRGLQFQAQTDSQCRVSTSRCNDASFFDPIGRCLAARLRWRSGSAALSLAATLCRRRTSAARHCRTSPNWSRRSARRSSTSAPPSVAARARRRVGRDRTRTCRSSFAASAFRSPGSRGPRPAHAAAARRRAAAARRRLGLHPQRRRLRDDQRARGRRRRRGMVTLTDKREFKAKIIGADKRTDVALVKIDATGLPAVRIGDVNRLKVGEWVMAIGSPFGLENTVTAGIVSAKARDTGDFLPFIQTDVAINPGNSGGPLINMRGEVVGINSQIYSRSGGFMGISFAIPIDEATRVCRSAAHQRPRGARPHRRADRSGDQGGGRSRSVSASRSARWCAASRAAGRPTRPASRRATSSRAVEGKHGREGGRPAAHRRLHQTRQRRRRCRCSAAAATGSRESRSPSSSPRSARRDRRSATPKAPAAVAGTLGLGGVRPDRCAEARTEGRKAACASRRSMALRRAPACARAT